MRLWLSSAIAVAGPADAFCGQPPEEQSESVNVLQVGKNFLFSLVGNYAGGGLVIGLFYA